MSVCVVSNSLSKIQVNHVQFTQKPGLSTHSLYLFLQRKNHYFLFSILQSLQILHSLYDKIDPKGDKGSPFSDKARHNKGRDMILEAC